MANQPSKRLVHVSTLLQMFKDTGYEDAVLNGTAQAGTAYRDAPAPPHQPPGTRSQSVPCFLRGVKIAVCHRYLLPDGRLGASGLPDPKLAQYRGCVLFCHHSGCACPICTTPPEDWRTVLKADASDRLNLAVPPEPCREQQGSGCSNYFECAMAGLSQSSNRISPLRALSAAHKSRPCTFPP